MKSKNAYEVHIVPVISKNSFEETMLLRKLLGRL